MKEDMDSLKNLLKRDDNKKRNKKETSRTKKRC